MGTGHPELVMFDKSIHHDEMANSLMLSKQDILGAGFIRMKPDDGADDIILEDYLPECFGSSVRLGIVSRGEADTKLLWKLLRLDY